MIPVGKEYSYNDKIVFITGSNQHPIIDRIVKVNGENEAVIGFCLQEVIDNAGQHDSLDYLGEIAGKKIFEQYTSANFETYGALKKEREGYNRESTIYSNENRGRGKNTKKHNGFVNLKDKENAKTEKEFNDPNGKYSKDDTIFDDFEDEEWLWQSDERSAAVDPDDPLGLMAEPETEVMK